MVIKLRGNRPALYRSVREGNRVRSVYLGIGDEALQMLACDQAVKREAKARRQADEALERQSRNWSQTVDATIRAVLIARGYHQHKRGEWRKKMASSTPATTTPAIEATPATPASRELPIKVQGVFDRLMAGDKTITQAEASRLLKYRPEMLNTHGSPSFALKVNWISNCYGDGDDNAFERQAMYSNVERVKVDLAGPNPTPAELLLAERASLCWLETSVLELGMVKGGKMDLNLANYQMRRVDSANRRFLAAVRTLAIVRKLAVPDVRINIDGRQVHLGGMVPPSATCLDDGRSG